MNKLAFLEGYTNKNEQHLIKQAAWYNPMSWGKTDEEIAFDEAAKKRSADGAGGVTDEEVAKADASYGDSLSQEFQQSRQQQALEAGTAAAKQGLPFQAAYQKAFDKITTDYTTQRDNAKAMQADDTFGKTHQGQTMQQYVDASNADIQHGAEYAQQTNAINNRPKADYSQIRLANNYAIKNRLQPVSQADLAPQATPAAQGYTTAPLSITGRHDNLANTDVDTSGVNTVYAQKNKLKPAMNFETANNFTHPQKAPVANPAVPKGDAALLASMSTQRAAHPEIYAKGQNKQVASNSR